MVKENTMKQTEIGLIPEHWLLKNIGSIAKVSGRVGWKGYTKKDLVLLGPYAIGAKHINKNNKLDLSDPTCLSNEKYIESPEIFVFKDDLLIVQRGTIGKLVLIEENIGEATINPSMLIIRTKKDSSKFLYYYLLSKEGQNQISKDVSSTGVPMITQFQVNGFQIPLPPLPEQEAIAEALSDADACIESLEQLIAKKRLIKQGAMQELLSPKEDWEVKKLGDFLVNVVDNRGKTPPNSPDGEHHLIETASVSFVDKNVDYSKVTKYVSDQTYQQWFRKHPHKGDLLVSTVGEYSGASALYYLNKGTIAQNLVAIRLDPKMIQPDYLLYWSKSLFYSVQLKKVMMHQAQPSLKVPWLLNFEISFPTSLTEQTRIATILSDMDVELEALEGQLGKARKVKQGMMQELLTGRVRLV
ncbi:restriction endonuclease subunit S [Pedobacter agri]|uniref:restriction endonuclease subunit S n=1 Tax=Pedobacter agri TaxID=454586 RepID=UPI002931679C|nr:restriction endonuclease subunit S [Pedobacter agri]